MAGLPFMNEDNLLIKKIYCIIITNMSISLSGIDLKYFDIAIT